MSLVALNSLRFRVHFLSLLLLLRFRERALDAVFLLIVVVNVLTFLPFTFDYLAVGEHEFSLAVHKTFIPLAFIHAAIFEVELAIALLPALLVVTFVVAALRELESAFTVVLPIVKIALVGLWAGLITARRVFEELAWSLKDPVFELAYELP